MHLNFRLEIKRETKGRRSSSRVRREKNVAVEITRRMGQSKKKKGGRREVDRRGGKPRRLTLFGVCKHLPRSLLLPQPSLSGFVKALGALIPGCRMRRIGRRTRSFLAHTICLPALRPLNLSSFTTGTPSGVKDPPGKTGIGSKAQTFRRYRRHDPLEKSTVRRQLPQTSLYDSFNTGFTDVYCAVCSIHLGAFNVRSLEYWKLGI